MRQIIVGQAGNFKPSRRSVSLRGASRLAREQDSGLVRSNSSAIYLYEIYYR